MNEEPYKNRELNEMFADLKEGQNRIETQVKITNGRVTSLEKFKYYWYGVTSVLTAIVIPILAWALYTLVNINQNIHSAIDEALSAYEITK